MQIERETNQTQAGKKSRLVYQTDQNDPHPPLLKPGKIAAYRIGCAAVGFVGLIMIKPYYEDSAVKIFHGDCRKILPELDPVDLVLTDPPYGIGDKMSGGTWGSAKKYEEFRSWDVAPNQELINLIISMSTYCIVWGGNYFNLPPSRCWLVWDKKNAVPTMADCELAWTNIDKPAKRFSCGVGIHSFGHPTQKPIELMSWCILQSPKSETILDTFMGSGTTLRAAKDMGKKAIGIEVSEKYCAIAAQRMSQEVLDFGTL